jgi:hypothetical protein
MARNRVRYLFGRLNLMPIRSYSEKLAWLSETLRSDGEIRDHNIVWQIFRVNDLETQDMGIFLCGYLGKYREETKIEVASRSVQDVDIQTIENLVTAKALFFLHVKSGILAYHSVPNQIPPGTFRTRFEQLLFKKAGSFFMDAEIDAIDEESSLREQLLRFDLVKEVRIVLHPSNPSNRDIWRRVDQRLHALGATQYTEYIKTKNPDRGLKVANDEEVNSKISMAEDGYGKVTAKGEIKGEEHTVTTSSNPVVAFAPTTPETPNNILRHLQAPFSRILSRFK